jgi:hypothetical protein
MINYQCHHKYRMVQNQDYGAIVVYMYDEYRAVASSANDSAIELDVCNQESLQMNIRLTIYKLIYIQYGSITLHSSSQSSTTEDEDVSEK